MTWAYTHIDGPASDADLTQQWQLMFWSFVWRTKNGVIDTLGWEGFREGVDDADFRAAEIGPGILGEEWGQNGELDQRGTFLSFTSAPDS